MVRTSKIYKAIGKKMQNRSLLVILAALVIMLSLNLGIASKWLSGVHDGRSDTALSISDIIQALNVVAVTLTLS